MIKENINPFKYVPMHYAARTHEKMQEVLMTPDAPGPAVHYHMIRDDMDMVNKRGTNITIWEAGKVGKEYIKTYGHYHVGELNETYKIDEGKGIVLLQELKLNEKGIMIPSEVKKFTVIPVKVGDKVFIPANCGHLAVNIGERFFVTEDDSPVNFEGKKDEASMPGHADYEMVKQMRGFAFYVVEENGKPALVRNKLYKEINGIETAGLPILS
jgi:oxalate decarboxylase/phosphoglucose isomerase-like protein (cupin superfamily)